MNQSQVQAVLDFWFSHGWDDWWRRDAAFDAEIRERFHELWEAQRENVPEHLPRRRPTRRWRR